MSFFAFILGALNQEEERRRRRRRRRKGEGNKQQHGCFHPFASVCARTCNIEGEVQYNPRWLYQFLPSSFHGGFVSFNVKNPSF
jgi:hypothetical protein